MNRYNRLKTGKVDRLFSHLILFIL